MTSSLDGSFNFADLHGFSALRAASDTPEGRRAVAQQFEGIFLNLMLSQMRSASSIDGGLIDDDRLELQQNMFDQQLALSLARGKGIGLADAILRSLGESGVTPRAHAAPFVPPAAPGVPAVAATADAVGEAVEGSTSPPTAPLAERAPHGRGVPAGHTTTAPIEPARPAGASDDGDFAASPQAFVAALWPHAERAAQALGTVPDVLVAQAALETGWGRSMPRNQYGEASLNLFGIKAGADWRGPRAVVKTLEFVDGVAEQRREPFRMYRSLDQSFGDYVALVRAKPRYAGALNAATPDDYARALQQGGYATDPDYAAKIGAILARGLPGREPAARADQVIAESADKAMTGTPVRDRGDGV